MADTTTTTPPTSDSSSKPQETTISSTPKPSPEPKRAWADEVDDEVDQPTSSSTLEPPNIDSLTINDSNPNPNKLLDDPDDSNIKAVTSGDTLYSTATTFEDLNLSPELLKGLYVEMGFSRPSKIQSISLPMMLSPPYKDLVAQAHNGSGKTTCFVLGMLSRVDPKLKAPQALCICPTRELAIQNLEVLRKMGKYTGIVSACAVPADKSHYVHISKMPPVTAQIIIGTPGTFQRWLAYKKLSMSYIRVLVFDEADQMLAEDGFKDDSLKIMKEIEKHSAHCQVLLFSATFNDTVKNFVSRVVKDGNEMFVKKEELSLDVVKQYKVNLPDELAKLHVIRDKIFLLGEKLGQTIIFVRSRDSARNLHTTLTAEGYGCTTIHGAVEKEERDKIVKEFKEGLTKVLISTDLLARGFDQSQVNLVVNYDMPGKYQSYPPVPDYEVYLHRCGRAGRFGRKGAVFNLLCGDEDHNLMDMIQEHFRSQIQEVPNWQREEDFEAALKAAGLL